MAPPFSSPCFSRTSSEGRTVSGGFGCCLRLCCPRDWKEAQEAGRARRLQVWPMSRGQEEGPRLGLGSRHCWGISMPFNKHPFLESCSGLCFFLEKDPQPQPEELHRLVWGLWGALGGWLWGRRSSAGGGHRLAFPLQWFPRWGSGPPGGVMKNWRLPSWNGALRLKE